MSYFSPVPKRYRHQYPLGILTAHPGPHASVPPMKGGLRPRVPKGLTQTHPESDPCKEAGLLPFLPVPLTTSLPLPHSRSDT